MLHTFVNLSPLNVIAFLKRGLAGAVLPVFMAAWGVTGLAHAGEFQFGSGDFSLKGGLLGLENKVESSTQVVTFKEQHSKILDTRLFYNYSLSTYSSNRFQNETNSLNTIGGKQLLLPNTNFDWQGIDAQVTLGYDIFKKSSQDYFGVGLSLGVALPYIDNSGNNSGSDYDGNSGEANTIIPPGASLPIDFFASKTEFTGRKLGPKVMFGKSLNRLAAVYGEMSYARQAMQVKNSTFDVNSNIGGDYFSYELGMRYQPFSVKKDFGFITLQPSLYFTFGVNYSELRLDEFKVDLSGQDFDLDSVKLESSSTTLNFGVGYSF